VLHELHGDAIPRQLFAGSLGRLRIYRWRKLSEFGRPV
jgi:hypothetical protein